MVNTKKLISKWQEKLKGQHKKADRLIVINSNNDVNKVIVDNK